MEDKIKELEELSKPLIQYLKENYDSHSTLIISEDRIKLVRDEISIPLEIEDN